MSWIKPEFGEDGSSGASPAKTSKIFNISQTETENILQDTSLATNWVEIYKPKCTEELVVDTTKIMGLKQWLQKSMNFKSTLKLLLLTGPPGSGKTTTFNAICKDLGFRINEWLTPFDRSANDFESSTEFYYPLSAAHQFKENLFIATRYRNCLENNPSRQVLLIKDFPYVFIQKPSVLHDILDTLSGSFMSPVVFICNKTSYCNELFPHSIKAKFAIDTIAFNPVTEKRVCRVLKTIFSRRSKSKNKEEPIPDNILSQISYSCQGDLRNAIVRLHYLISTENSIRTRTKDLEPVKLVTKSEHIDFFHGLGRVLYPKRTESDKGLRFVHSAEAIVENFESEPGGFLSQLHENYPSRMGDIEDLSKGASRLATSDILRSRWQDRDIFNHYSLAVAVRGLMVTNRTPQKARFEAFRKSQTSRLEVDSKAIELEGKRLFYDLDITHYDRLVDVLPFSKLLMTNLHKGQLEYVHKTCNFSKNT